VLAADVPEMATELQRGRLALLPSFSGSGIKNKVLEAFCAGLPVISNQMGIQGVGGAEAGKHYLLAEGAEEIAAAAAEVLADPQLGLRLATAAHRLVLERYTWERGAAKLLELYGSSPP